MAARLTLPRISPTRSVLPAPRYYAALSTSTRVLSTYYTALDTYSTTALTTLLYTRAARVLLHRGINHTALYTTCVSRAGYNHTT